MSSKSYNHNVSVIALGLNHTTAPLDLRGRFAFAPDQLPSALRGFRERLQRAMPGAPVTPQVLKVDDKGMPLPAAPPAAPAPAPAASK